MCCLRSKGTEPGREDPISGGAYSLIIKCYPPHTCTWKSTYLPNVYSACSLCQALCWALGIQYTRQKKQPLPSVNRPTGREDKHANQSPSNLYLKIVKKEAEPGQHSQEQKWGISEARSEDWASLGDG